MKTIFLILIASLALFGVEKAEFPNNNMNVVISGVFLDNSSDENNKEYKKFGNILVKTIKALNKSDDSLTDDIQKVSFKFKNTKELSLFQVAQEYELYKTKLVSALADELKPNTLKIGIKFIPSETNLKLDVYRVYNENMKTIPLVEFLSMSFPKNVDYSSVIKYLILSNFQEFQTKKREAVAPVILSKNEKYTLKFYSNDFSQQKYFSQNVKNRNINLLNELKIFNMDKSFSIIGDDVQVSLADAKKYCSLYNMKIPDLSLVNELKSDSFSEGGLYKLDNEVLKIYIPNSTDKNYFLCAGTSVKQISTIPVTQLKLEEDKWPKIFSKKEVDLTTIKYETD
jgi:hypothetical protein